MLACQRGEQNLNFQIDALKKASCSCNHIYTGKISGSKSDRPGLNKCLNVF